MTIEAGGRFLGSYRDSPTGWFSHVVVVKNGRIYDGFGPETGLEVEDYKNLWEYADAINWPF